MISRKRATDILRSILDAHPAEYGDLTQVIDFIQTLQQPSTLSTLQQCEMGAYMHRLHKKYTAEQNALQKEVYRIQIQTAKDVIKLLVPLSYKAFCDALPSEENQEASHD